MAKKKKKAAGSTGSATSKPAAKKRSASGRSGKSRKRLTKAEAGDRQRLRSADYQRLIAAATREIGAIPPVQDPERRASCEFDLKLYLETYTAKAIRLGWSDDHLELIESLQKMILDGGQIAVGMPRGTGKTTIVIRAIMWAISYGHHVSVTLIAATDTKAKKALKGLKREFQSNPLLLEDFPEICFPIRCLQGINNRQGGQTCEGKPTSIQWGQEELTFPAIEGSVSSGARVIAGGITSSLVRGENETTDEGDVNRPTLVLIDDFQTRTSAKNPDTVQYLLDIIEADIAGMCGPDESITMIAAVTVIYPDDGADQLLDFETRPDWNGIRKKFLLAEPTRMDLWEQYKELRRQSFRLYKDIRLATAFYKKNRKAMDAGAKVSWAARFRRKTKVVDGRKVDVKEISAIQHAMEWLLVKPRAFASELQNQPESLDAEGKSWLTAKQIEKKTHPLKRRVVPQSLIETRRLFSHIDVHEDLLYWAIGAVAANGSAGIIDYATYPKQRLSYFQKSDARKTMQTEHGELGVDGAIRHALLFLAKELLDAVYIGEDQATQFHIDLLLIDCGAFKQIVNNVVLELLREPRYAGRVMMSRGFGVDASDTPFAERRNPKKTIVGNNVMQKPRKGALDAPRLDIDTNAWKETTNDRWATKLGTPGSLTVFKGRDHQGFSEHQKAETATETFGRGRRVYKFKQLPRDNHWYDNVVDLLAAASFRGCDTPAKSVPTVRRRKRKRGKVTVAV